MKIDNSMLNENQNFAVNNYSGPMLIIAGAGSGKTRVITQRIANMLNHNVRQKNILALTFTVKAATEMKERVENIFGRKLRDLQITNFHSFGCNILKKHIHLLDYKSNFSIYDTLDQMYVLKSTLHEMGKDPVAYSIPDMLSIFSDIKTSRIDIDKFGQEYKDIYQEYCDYMKACNGVDFDDLIYLPIKLFEQNPELLKNYQEQYKYILVDEFQDTSQDQYKLIYKLSKNHSNICVVGDDDQSIYGFRGADYQNIVNFENDFPSRALIKLEQNYRSSKQILDVANELIKNNTNRKEKTLWSAKNHENITLYSHENEYEEIKFIIDDIKVKKFDDNLQFSDFAILSRTNSIMSKIEEELIQNKIPYYISGGFSFFDKAEIRDMISYIRYILNPLDDSSLIRVINKPRRNIGKVSIQTITTLAKREKQPVYKILLSIKNEDNKYGLKQNTVDGVHHFLNILDDYRPKLLSNKNFAITLNSLITDLEYQNYLISQYGATDNIAKYKMQNVRRFIDMLDRYEKDPDNYDDVDIYKYVNNIALASIIKEDKTKEKNKVGLLTMHSAKGLEWDTVYLIALEDGIIPHTKSTENIENNQNPIEEERRLFYVAITRAKRNLILSYCKKRKIMKKEQVCYPSSFLTELPKHLIDEKTYEDETQASLEDFQKLMDKFK